MAANIPVVVNVRVSELRKAKNPKPNLQTWMDDPDNEYVGRGKILDGYTFPPRHSLWANPFKVPRDGDLEQVIKKYETHIRSMVDNDPEHRAALVALSQKKLIGCWCVKVPSAFGAQGVKVVCHAQVLQKLIHEYLNK